MKSALKRFLENLLPPEATVETDEEALNFAAALLLFEVANADYNLDDAEWQSMKKALKEVLGINTDNANKLLKIAEGHSQSNTSLQPFTRLINDEFDVEKKKQLMKAMWQIAYADGNLDKYEEHYLRKISALLYIPHSQFIQQKLAVTG
jgi:uncharacterized tellurite resistance protein B-like protein